MKIENIDPTAALLTWTRALERLQEAPASPEASGEMLTLVLRQMHFWAGRLRRELDIYHAEVERLVVLQ